MKQRELARLHVLNNVLEYQIPIGQAAEILGVSERHTRRLLSSYGRDGAAVLAHGNRGRQPHNAVLESEAAAVVRLARTEYAGTNHTHLTELLRERESIDPSRPTAASLVHELMEARDERRLLNLQRQLSRLNLLIIDELGFVPLSRTGAELLFEVFSQRYERGSILVTTNLPFDEWTEVFGSERLTGALLDRLTHHVHILEMNGGSYRLKRSRENAAAQAPEKPEDA